MKPRGLSMVIRDETTGEYIFTAGKYTGAKLFQVELSDPDYLQWIYREVGLEKFDPVVRKALLGALGRTGLVVVEKDKAPEKPRVLEKKSFPDMLERNLFTDEWTFAWGKWKGKTLDHVASIDVGYLDWILRSPVKHRVGKGLAAIKEIIEKMENMESLHDKDEANLIDPNDI